MSTKKTIIFHHLGFPIKLISCPHILVEGELVPDVDYEQLEELMFRVLPLKPTRLTGAELKFIRHHLGKTQAQFAKWLEDNVDDSSISKWEAQDLKPTGMLDSMERSLRMQLIVRGLKRQRRTTVPVMVMEKVSASIATNRSDPLALKMPIPAKLPKDLLSAVALA
jgi:DNA-binding transcriptional regulator YiaG